MTSFDDETIGGLGQTLYDGTATYDGRYTYGALGVGELQEFVDETTDEDDEDES